MPIDIISSNPLSHLNQVRRKRESNYIFELPMDDEPDVSPAYIVEISAEGKLLQQAHPVTIVRL
ncbi:hypothetical protein [Sporomusa acidovorans]|uniref:Uncharacterized protein n=1 Tax=Sporomusa acidovorans (strain ATCC 49682 / DSM 3132 / Mol) TaxID=1123286 RepID=A0ABZ3IZR9_SPOA4|nr:hypothetical protein [Sporomusa acidovorans]OZC24217.1 hypothetical protein SPACI_01080 [Sporomusa acidovorans DSM 3132]SDF55627.1 hypothetical protein SAMN04488499_10586 [Sporomusa acidovorans]